MRFSDEPVCLYLFRQKIQHSLSPVHVVTASGLCKVLLQITFSFIPIGQKYGLQATRRFSPFLSTGSKHLSLKGPAIIFFFSHSFDWLFPFRLLSNNINRQIGPLLLSLQILRHFFFNLIELYFFRVDEIYSSGIFSPVATVDRAYDCQCQSRNRPGFNPSIFGHSGIWGAADEAVLKKVLKNTKQNISPA